MSAEPEVIFGVSADGRPVAEAEVADLAQARALLAAARAAGAELAWAHSAAELRPAGFLARPGYRQMTLQVAAATGLVQPLRQEPRAGSDGPDSQGGWVSQDGPVVRSQGGSIAELAPGADSAALWALAFRGQWGHKTAQQWPPDLPDDSVTLCLRRAGEVAGLCRVEPLAGLIDAPGLVPAHRDLAGYRELLTAALALARAASVTMESWGDEQDRVVLAESFGLHTTLYVPGWEFDLHT